MTTQCRFSLQMILAAGILIAATLSCNFKFETRESITTTFEQNYAINPQSLLESLAQDDASFTSIENEPDLPPPDQQISVDWKQSDYMRIANMLSEYAWGERLNGWLLKSMYFALGCTEIDHGFQNAYFRYFQNDQAEEVRIERLIRIDPRSKSVYALEQIYSPRLTDWGYFDIQQLKFSSDEVLALAESNGGKEKRLAVDDKCNITILLPSPDSPGYRGWNVDYSTSDDPQLFEIAVDPKTGEIRIP